MVQEVMFNRAMVRAPESPNVAAGRVSESTVPLPPFLQQQTLRAHCSSVIGAFSMSRAFGEPVPRPAPIRKIPDDLLDAFTMGGRIPIVYSDRKAFRPASVTLITECRRLTGFSLIKPMRRRC